MHLEYALDADAEFVLHCYTENVTQKKETFDLLKLLKAHNI